MTNHIGDSGDGGDGARRRRPFRKWISGTSRRRFLFVPAAVLAAEWALSALGLRDGLTVNPWGLPVLLWGLLQFKLSGRYRSRIGGGGPGLDVPPRRIVDSGIYRWVRNPMYLGYLIFLAGLALTLSAWTAVAWLALQFVRFDRKIRGDEARLEALFGAEYGAYRARTSRWVPFVY